jgi:tungstate transport system substrate-binding protein
MAGSRSSRYGCPHAARLRTAARGEPSTVAAGDDDQHLHSACWTPSCRSSASPSTPKSTSWPSDGQAIEIGKSGDADVILVHSRSAEDAFVADGFGVERFPVMFNDFILVGPPGDPAGIASADTGTEALQRIYDSHAAFVSRGDDSGTHAKELSLWKAAGLAPAAADAWYQSIGQGMGETLQFANEELGYTLADRGTYLSLAGSLPNLNVLFGGGRSPKTRTRRCAPYGVIR